MELLEETVVSAEQSLSGSARVLTSHVLTGWLSRPAQVWVWFAYFPVVQSLKPKLLLDLVTL